MTSFPHPFVPDPSTRAGRMMTAGRVKVTALNAETQEHITILLKCIADNRKRQHNPEINKNWVDCILPHCTHLFAEVPSQDEWNDKVGTFYPKTGKWFDADNADRTRVNVAQLIGQWLMQDDPTLSICGYTFSEALECGAAGCGRELTDPVSIERGIGPVCFGRITGSQHQVKGTSVEQMVLDQFKPIEDVPKIEDADLSDVWTPSYEMQVFANNSTTNKDWIRALREDQLEDLLTSFEEEVQRREEIAIKQTMAHVDRTFMGR